MSACLSITKPSLHIIIHRTVHVAHKHTKGFAEIRRGIFSLICFSLLPFLSKLDTFHRRQLVICYAAFPAFWYLDKLQASKISQNNRLLQKLLNCFVLYNFVEGKKCVLRKIKITVVLRRVLQISRPNYRKAASRKLHLKVPYFTESRHVWSCYSEGLLSFCIPITCERRKADV